MQLRLVEGPTRVRQPAAAASGAGKDRQGPGRASTRRAGAGKGRPLKGAVKGAPGKGSRRAVHWADWHLDARTRRVGRAGVAAAKAALEQAARPEPGTPLSKAS